MKTVFTIIALLALLCSHALAAPKPNILFIAIDDQNDWIGHMGGHPLAKTPHLDRLAARGTTFLNAHCQSPLCNPSRASLLLGLRPTTTGIYGLAPAPRTLPELRDRVSLPQHFAAQGYRTAATGKIYHGGTGAGGAGRGKAKAAATPQTAYAIRLRDELVIYDVERSPVGEQWNSNAVDMKKDNPTKVLKIPKKEGLILKPGRVYLARTVEYVEAHNIVPVVDGRSSVGRLGMWAHIWAGFVDNGFIGHVIWSWPSSNLSEFIPTSRSASCASTRPAAGANTTASAAAAFTPAARPPVSRPGTRLPAGNAGGRNCPFQNLEW